jgi:3,4-dihydroxy 2-butanone 4-phosphate synthase/GTP cyclohydrolase II
MSTSLAPRSSGPVELGSALSNVDEAVDDVRTGRYVVVVDTSAEQNSGRLALAAEAATPPAVNFMLAEARGPLYLCLTSERCEQLGLTAIGTSQRSGASFMVSIEARHGLTTGGSAEERSRTIRLAGDPESRPTDFVYPGHLPVVRARGHGVLARARVSEAATDLVRLAGLQPAAVFAEILNADGAAATGADLVSFGRRHGIKLVSISDLVLHRRRAEKLVEQVASVRMPTRYGEFWAVAFREVLTGAQHVALIKDEIDSDDDVLVRVHTQCLLGDVFHSAVCDCGQQLHAAIERIEEEGRGVVLYLSRPERGLGLLWQMAELENGADHPVARAAEEENDARDYGIGSQMLVELGVRRVRILTDNARDLSGVELFGLKVVDQVLLRGAEPGAATLPHHQRLDLDEPL